MHFLISIFVYENSNRFVFIAIELRFSLPVYSHLRSETVRRRAVRSRRNFRPVDGAHLFARIRRLSAAAATVANGNRYDGGGPFINPCLTYTRTSTRTRYPWLCLFTT